MGLHAGCVPGGSQGRHCLFGAQAHSTAVCLQPGCGFQHPYWSPGRCTALPSRLPTCPPFVDRTFAQLVLWRLLELRPGLVQSDPSLAAFASFFSSNADIKRLRAGLGSSLDTFDELATTPRGVLGQVGGG